MYNKPTVQLAQRYVLIFRNHRRYNLFLYLKNMYIFRWFKTISIFPFDYVSVSRISPSCTCKNVHTFRSFITVKGTLRFLNTFPIRTCSRPRFQSIVYQYKNDHTRHFFLTVLNINSDPQKNVYLNK